MVRLSSKEVAGTGLLFLVTLSLAHADFRGEFDNTLQEAYHKTWQNSMTGYVLYSQLNKKPFNIPEIYFYNVGIDQNARDYTDIDREKAMEALQKYWKSTVSLKTNVDDACLTILELANSKGTDCEYIIENFRNTNAHDENFKNLSKLAEILPETTMGKVQVMEFLTKIHIELARGMTQAVERIKSTSSPGIGSSPQGNDGDVDYGDAEAQPQIEQNPYGKQLSTGYTQYGTQCDPTHAYSRLGPVPPLDFPVGSAGQQWPNRYQSNALQQQGTPPYYSPLAGENPYNFNPTLGGIPGVADPELQGNFYDSPNAGGSQPSSQKTTNGNTSQRNLLVGNDPSAANELVTGDSMMMVDTNTQPPPIVNPIQYLVHSDRDETQKIFNSLTLPEFAELLWKLNMEDIGTIYSHLNQQSQEALNNFYLKDWEN
ncbi:hypothetical protein IWQ61_009223 [Dispira simplex]|nr:hypothetical protein IWQ61_009223 [Dispira simplex]